MIGISDKMSVANLDNQQHRMKLCVLKKMIGNADKMPFANLDNQHQRSLNSYLKSS